LNWKRRARQTFITIEKKKSKRRRRRRRGRRRERKAKNSLFLCFVVESL